MPRRGLADETSVRFGAAIKQAREAKGLTIEAAARLMVSMDPKYLSSLEKGFHSPTLATAKRVADALGTTLSELVRGL